MARDRLQQSQQNYGDHSAPGNPYAQAAGNPYAQAAPNQNRSQYAPVPTQQYGQQEQYGNGGSGNGGQDFWAEMNLCNSMLSELEQKVSGVREAHQATLNSTDPNAVRYADEMAADAKRSREQCKDALKKLNRMTKGDRQLRAQVDAAAGRFKDIIQQHQAVERDYRQKTKDRAARQYKIVKPDATPQEVQDVVNSDNPQIFSQALLNSNKYGAARGALKEVQERQVEIAKVEKTITELAQMFNEMSMLVEQQDDQLQEVHQQTMAVNNDVSQGNIQLDQAVKKAKAARRKKWICFWIVIIIIIIIVIAVAVPLAIQNSNKK